MATLIGVVSQVIGEVYAVAGDGTRRPLSEGDRVFVGEQIVTGVAGAISVAMRNGQLLTLGRESSLNLNEQMLAGGSDQLAPSAQVPADMPSDSDLTDVERLQAAIEAGVDPTLEGEATAAGPGAGGAPGAAGGGHSFVLLGETAGALEPIIGFPTEGLSSGPEFPDPEAGLAAPAAIDFSPEIEITYFDGPPDGEGGTPGVLAGPAVVDEAALGSGTNPASNGEFTYGSLVINSPDGVSALEVQGANGVWVNVQGGGTVIGVYGTLVFDAAGNWVYTLTSNTLNHSNPNATGAADQVGESFPVRVFDNDGDVSPTVLLNVVVYDDGPVAAVNSETEGFGEVAVDESLPSLGGAYTDGVAQAVLAAAIVQAQFNSALGADGGSTAYSLALNTGAGTSVGSGLFAVNSAAPGGKGVEIQLSQSGNVISGNVGGDTYFTLTIDPASGEVTLNLLDNIWHSNTGNHDDAQSLLLGTGVLQLVQTLTDGDGDSDSVSIDLGAAGAFSFEDDGPRAQLSEQSEGLGRALVDESLASLGGAYADGVASAVLSAAVVQAQFNSVFGADGAAAGDAGTVYSLALSGADVPSGLFAVDASAPLGKGEQIVLNQVGNVVTGSAGGVPYFTLTINPVTGAVTLGLLDNIWHADTSNADDSQLLSLAEGALLLTQTVTDGDGDSDSVSIDLGAAGAFSFEDDGPRAQLSEESEGLGRVLVDESLASLGGAYADGVASAVLSAAVVQAQFNSVFGADGAAAGDAGTVYSLALSGANVPSGLFAVDASAPLGKGEQIVLNQVGNVVTGSAGGVPYFTLTINPVTGAVTLGLLDNIWHADTSNADDSQLLSLAEGALLLTQTVTDGDGDSDSVSIDLGAAGAFSFEDDGPTGGSVVAAVVLDDEGLAGGINGGPGDVAGAATSTSGNLAFNAGADGLKSIALSGPATLGTENVTSSWDTATNTLTISSVRGALLTVVLTDPASGAYTINLLQPLMHPVSGTEDDITLNIGYTVTDGDNDSATGSLVVTIDDDTPTIQAGNIGVTSFVTFQGSDAGFSNSYGYYNKAPDGSPIDGKVIWANVHAQSVGDVGDLSGLDPANTGFFIIPNGGANAGLANGSVVTFELVAGQWQANLGGVPLVGADGANVLFSDASLNPGGSHLQDTGSVGNQNWEDKTLTSDYDYNDVSANVTWGSALQVDESAFHIDATANFSGVFNVQPGADGLQSLTYNLSVQNANSGLVDTETNQAVILSFNAGVIEGRTSGTNQLVFTLSVDVAGTVTLDQIRSIVHPTGDPDEAKFLGAGHISLNAVVTDGDGDQASASLDIGTVISFKDDGPSVLPNALVQLDDDALANGIPGGVGDDADSINASGTLAHSFGADGAGSLQWLTTGAPAGFTYQTSGSSLLVKQGATLVLTVTLNQSTGAYTVTQNAPIQHATADQENNQAFTLSYQVTDKDGDSATGTLSLNIDDDTPQAQDDTATVQASQGKDFNVAFVLDFSGSIDNTELNTMLQAVRAAGQALFNGTTGDVTIKVVAFSGTATSYAAVTDYAAFSTLIGSLNPAETGTRPFNGQTDFTAAIQETMGAYTPVAGASNQVFFISDGNPNEQTGSGGNSLSNATATAWSAFVNGPVGVSVTAIGVGNGINTARLQDVDLDGVGAPILVGDFNGLVDTLLGQIGALVSGNVLLGSDGVAGGGDDDAFGADGPGYIQSIVINGITYVWDGAGTIDPSSGPNIAGSQLSNITTAEGGKLSFNFSTGAWTYQAPSNVVGDKTETFTYTIVDKDGDPSSANLTVYVEDTSPIIAMVDEDELPGGITDNDAITTVATGNVGELVVGSSAGVQFSLSGSTAGLPTASSAGVSLVYSVVGNTLIAKAGASGPTIFTLQVQANGDYTFTLSGPLDHPVPGSDDNELLVMNFASILLASNGVDPVALLGDFLVYIENDVPTISAGSPVADSLQVDETNLSINTSVSFAASFSGHYGADGAGTTTYSLSVSAAGVDSGLDDSATGSNILLFNEAGVVVGRVGNATGAVSFTVSVNASGQVTLDQQRAIIHTPNSGADQESSLAAANLVQLSATITDKDGDTATASVNLGSAISFRDDGPSISSNAVAADSLQVDESNLSGNASISFAGAFTSSYGADDAGNIVYSLNVSAAGADSGLDDSLTGSNILLFLEAGNVVGRVGSAAGAVSFTVAVNAGNGTVTLDQQSSIIHTPNSGPNQEASLAAGNLIKLNATITDKDGDQATSSIDLGHAISFLDDAPSAVSQVQNGQAETNLNTNLIIVLDVSGSMGNSSGVGGMDRLQVAKNALLELLEQYDALGDVKVSFTTFSSSASSASSWLTVSAAKAAILAATDNGSTNYDAALIDAINSFGESGKITTGNVQNVAYFLSDGYPNAPSGDGGISSAAGSAAGWPAPYSNGGVSEEQAWINFLTANNIRAYALGMGSGVDAGALNPIAYNGTNGGSNTNAIVVNDFNDLTATLVATAQASPINGNLTAGGGFGSDGGFVHTLLVNGTTYTYSKSSNTFVATGGANNGSLTGTSLKVLTGSGSDITVNMLTGGYTFTPPSTITTAIALSIGFTLIDNDADATALASLNININPGSAPMVIRDDLVLTNVNTQGGNDVINIPTWALLANDSGSSSGLLSVLNVTGAVDGGATLSGATVTFTEESGGAADGGSFTYGASINGSTVLDTAVVDVVRSANSSTLTGTFRNEILLGRDGSDDTLNGGDGDDILIGLSGNDTLNGGNGNDILAGGAGNDALNGGAGIDTASYIDAASAVTVNLGVASAQNTGGAGTDTLSSIENLIGSGFNDTLIGNNSANLLFGGAGSDTLVGNGGDDILIGGLGADTMTGGSGKDTFLWQKGGLGGGVDHITDFNVDTAGVNSDILDLSQLLSGVGTNPSVLQDYLDFAFLGTTTTISIRTVAAGPVEQQVMLDNVNLSTLYSSSDEATVIMNMLDDNALKTA
ncbi:T1SS-143 domain-containing protein/type I secretion C-terminal target domain (VC_A0849 subclass) [Pseudomonas guineae]|uniref:T1SS-143 domain-containing protein/type I secretion C-terminal target domain (VC_A0849 subclass) n=1 Tax=Pseudomonas guineae TaxID=425504 RepID=A0A1I3HDS7_9PSED|nr:retention module-containing protein [Pseudomonas guineae]SFI33789.1 T1SS-143 domain-containing protein/type I secretion C-terminal target domain (VC_A0849 subclass) [Pseudomonas guineae]